MEISALHSWPAGGHRRPEGDLLTPLGPRLRSCDDARAKSIATRDAGRVSSETGAWGITPAPRRQLLLPLLKESVS